MGFEYESKTSDKKRFRPQLLKIATWNVNSLRMRLSQVLQWLTIEQPDVFALQETKITDDQFPP